MTARCPQCGLPFGHAPAECETQQRQNALRRYRELIEAAARLRSICDPDAANRCAREARQIAEYWDIKETQ